MVDAALSALGLSSSSPLTVILVVILAGAASYSSVVAFQKVLCDGKSGVSEVDVVRLAKYMFPVLWIIFLYVAIALL